MALFWEDNFENHLTPNWDTASCTGVFPGPLDGCNPSISTDFAFSGTHSLKSTFPGTWLDRPFNASVFPNGTIGMVAQGAWLGGIFDTRNYFANVGNGAVTNGQWYCIEEHLKMSGPGQSNGVIEVWKNGVQILSYTNLQLNGPNSINPPGCTSLCNSSQTTMTYLRHYAHEPSQGARYIDNLAVGTTRIGCSGAPTPDTTPPAVPTGLGVS